MKGQDVILCDGGRHFSYKVLPRVVIVGRPNVGKSTLFNRLLGRRRSITSNTSGVTRDSIEETVILRGFPLRLVDTSGFTVFSEKKASRQHIDTLVLEQTYKSIQCADKILLVLDGTCESAEDEEVIQYLRPYWGKLIAAVNKTEGGEEVHYNYARYGFSTLICVSAEHGRNIDALERAIIQNLFSVDERRELPKDDVVRLAIVGKPNTGKSTLMNYLMRRTVSLVCDRAGTTRDVVTGHVEFKQYKFIIADTAGIRKRQKVYESIEYYSVIRAISILNAVDIVLYIVDARDGFSEQDKKIVSQISKRNLGVIFLLNKWDLLEGSTSLIAKKKRDVRTAFGKMNFVPVVPVSAKTGHGISDALHCVCKIFAQLNTKVETSALNTALKDWVTSYPPPRKYGHVSLKYLVQVSVRPIEFLLFANRPDRIPENYVRFLQNRIREDLGLDSIDRKSVV